MCRRINTKILCGLSILLCLAGYRGEAQSYLQTAKVVASDRITTDNLGATIGISGNYMVVSARAQDFDAAGLNSMTDAGAAYIYERNTGTNVWTQVQKIVASDRAAGDKFGWSVAISGDRIVIGAYLQDKDASGANTLSDAGAAYIYERNNTTGVWAQAQKIVASDRVAVDGFGYSVSISGSRVVVGAWNQDLDETGANSLGNAGAAYIYDRNSGTGVWSQTQKIVASDRAGSNTFGDAVAISGDKIVIGAFQNGTDASNSNTLSNAGSAYIYERNTGNNVWSQVQKIVAADRTAADFYGNSVAISGDRLIVGAKFQDTDPSTANTLSSAGAAYIYDRNSGTGVWSQTQKIVNSDRVVSDQFGWSVSISGDRVAVGANQQDFDASSANSLTNAGAAYVFDRNTGTNVWAQTQKIVNTDRAAGDNFGYGVSISGARFAVGAQAQDQNVAGNSAVTDAGAAYVYDLNYTITASAGSNGSITPSGASNTLAGNTQTYTITPAAGYAVQDVLVDAVSVGAPASYAFGNVAAAHTISATFKQQISIDFDGTDDYISIPTNPVASSTAMTFEAWIYWKGGSAAQHIMDFGNSAGNSIYLTPSNSSNGYLRFAISSNSTNEILDGTAALGTNAWHHVAVTTTAAGVWTLYVDGVQAGQNTGHTFTPATIGTTTNNWFGRSQSGSDPYFYGDMDEIRVWNRALCQAEIQNNISGEIVTSSVGLVSYYLLNQGTANSSNSSITTVTDASASSNNGTLNNFSLTSTGSNFVTGAPALTATSLSYAPVTPSSVSESITEPVNTATAVNGCGAITVLAPSGASPVSGNVTSEVVVDNSVQTYNGHAYVQRHYSVEPAANASTATATMTLYYTQAEFTAYNAANGSDPNLPTSGSNSDPNIPNVRVTQYHGTSGNATPGTYSGSTVVIVPTSVVYANSRWEVTFPITGFSGFTVSGVGYVPLPVKLLAFRATPVNRQVQLNWEVSEQVNVARYTVERSADGKTFSPLTPVKSDAHTSQYTAVDATPMAGRSYYRLRMDGLSGNATYSNIEQVSFSDAGTYFQLSPVPAAASVTIETNDAALNNTAASLNDITGRTLRSLTITTGRQSISLEGLQAGIYMIRLANGSSYKLVKE